MNIQNNDLHIAEIKPIISPEALKRELPGNDRISMLVSESRKIISDIIAGKDKRLLLITGPCSIHDIGAAREYALRLRKLQEEVLSQIFIVMRMYFEKPRTALGWRGLIIDPDIDGSYNIEKGIRISRKILIDVLDMGLPTATELLDPIIPQYIADLVSWSAIGARTTESQIHRELASGLSMPVGFKNGTDGMLDSAINAQISSKTPHSFIGIDQKGRTCIVTTKGNNDTHVILRGGKNGPNYYEECVEDAEKELRSRKLEPAIMIDCSHANSGKSYLKQDRVFRSVIRYRKENYSSIIGAMLESNLLPGSQPIDQNIKALKYGVSITDECIGWDKTEEIIKYAYTVLREL